MITRAWDIYRVDLDKAAGHPEACQYVSTHEGEEPMDALLAAACEKKLKVATTGRITNPTGTSISLEGHNGRVSFVALGHMEILHPRSKS